ncbi:hypothetical protein [Streptomyces sp. NPDC042319]|uniref:hypothetical protein n=1 Tax=Streptomyces sp. NPDC042319 TaxID=3154332 RepID=UPI0033F1E2F0
MGIAPVAGPRDLAVRCFTAVCRLTVRIPGQPRPPATVKDAAYAWRQMVFHLSLCAPDEQRRIVGGMDGEVARHPAHVAARLAPVLAGLRPILGGGQFGADGMADGGRARRFLGWTTDGRHWLAEPAAPDLEGQRPNGAQRWQE